MTRCYSTSGDRRCLMIAGHKGAHHYKSTASVVFTITSESRTR